jgi:hypothetical protein
VKSIGTPSVFESTVIPERFSKDDVVIVRIPGYSAIVALF